VAESRDGRPRTFDFPGQILFIAAVGAFAYAVIEGPRAGWLSAEILGLFLVAAAALAAFIVTERRSADPMMDLTLFRDRTYSLAIVTVFTVLFAVYGMLLVITQYLQNVRGFSPTQAGLLLLPYSATCTLTALRAGKLMGIVGARRLILLGLASQIVGLGLMIAGLGQSTPVVVAGLMFSALGSGLCLTPITSLAMTAVPRSGRNGLNHECPARSARRSGSPCSGRCLPPRSGRARRHLAQAIPDATGGGSRRRDHQR
jgi:predicted MFS family arabinose efflux permease